VVGSRSLVSRGVSLRGASRFSDIISGFNPWIGNPWSSFTGKSK